VRIVFYTLVYGFDFKRLYFRVDKESHVSCHVTGDNVQLSTTFKPFSLMPADRTTFYRYLGSLTTPGCNEAVIWTVLKNPITISSAQVERHS
jgi:carbonic anhydrase